MFSKITGTSSNYIKSLQKTHLMRVMWFTLHATTDKSEFVDEGPAKERGLLVNAIIATDL